VTNEIHHRSERYLFCMQEIKGRYRSTVSEFSNFEASDSQFVQHIEFAALQLRKMIEVIGFACMTADLEQYQSVRPAFVKDWNFSDIMKRLRNLNPRCVPIPILLIGQTDQPKNYHLLANEQASQTVDILIESHGRLGTLMHADNPFGNRPNYDDEYRNLVKLSFDIKELVWRHIYLQAENKGGYIVEMGNVSDDEVRIKLFEAQDVL